MSPVADIPGTVRASPDGLGIGLYSADNQYRYWFQTEVEPRRRPGDLEATLAGGFPVLTPQTLVWVGLNPSRSDDNAKPRPTLASVLHWTERAGLRRVLGVNLYAYRLTDSREIRKGLRDGGLGDVIGEGNDRLLQYVGAHAQHVLLAWGSNGDLGGRGATVASLFPTGVGIGRCANGQPLHPARKSRALEFVPYAPERLDL